MKKMILILFVFFQAGCLSSDANTRTKDKTPLAVIKGMMLGGVKYVPSEDSVMFSEDDDIYTYYVYEQDTTGRTIEKKCYNVGPDREQYTADDTLKYHLSYKYDKKGRPVGDVCYNGIGADNQWFTSDDVETYHSSYEYDSSGNKSRIIRFTKDGKVFDYTTLKTSPQGAIIRDVVYKGTGADNQWFTEDDEIEKYHLFEYDSAGNLLRAMEYHIKHNGRGADNVWFTSDDVISSSKVFAYDAKGLLIKIKKYTSPGPDKRWFTDDDVLQYYTEYSYAEDAYLKKLNSKIKPE